MKKILFMTVAAILLLSSCVTYTRTSKAPTVESFKTMMTNLEGEKVNEQTMKDNGIEMADALNDDGTAIIKIPYKWFSGTGKADDKQMAIELARRDAYATISRILNNAVLDEAERSNVANNYKVQQAVTSHWKQVSISLEKACEPFGSTTIEYNPTTRMYQATAKVGIRGDRFNQLLNTAGNFKPSDLSGDELDQFIRTNKSIMEAARGN